MSIGKVATAIDKISPKTPNLLRVVFTQTAGNESDLNFFALDAKDYTTKQMLIDYVGTVPSILRLSFTNQTGDLTINWQTDIPPGYTQTYYQLYGNYVEAFIYVNGIPMGQQYDWTYDGSNNVNVVTFHFGDTQSGYIRFG